MVRPPGLRVSSGNFLTEVSSHFSAIILDIYGPSKNVKKSKGYLPILPAPGAFSVHTSMDKEMHRRKRKVISQGLGDDAVKAFEPEFLVHLRIFCDKLAGDKQNDDGNWTLPINMTDICIDKNEI